MARCTPAFLAYARRQYVETDQSLRSIARELDISLRTLRRIIDEQGWPKRSERLRDLSPAQKLAEQARVLLEAHEKRQRLR